MQPAGTFTCKPTDAYPMVVTQICLEPNGFALRGLVKLLAKSSCNTAGRVLQASIELLTMLIDLYVCKKTGCVHGLTCM